MTARRRNIVSTSMPHRQKPTYKIDRLGIDLWNRNDMVGGTR